MLQGRVSSRLYRFSWAIVLYTVIVIVWGAWVRISGSGAGCGEHWPLCHGAAIPIGAETKTWIEVSHRYSTAIFGLFIVAQLLFIRALTPKKHPARYWSWMTLVFTVTEALIGRFLVKHGLVDESLSLYRLVVMPLHLVNTSLLLCSEVLTAENIRFNPRSEIAPETTHELTQLNVQPQQRSSLTIGLVILLGLLLTSGAIAALGSHLMPSESLLEGLRHDLALDAHPAVRLRVLHPILGLLLPMAFWLLLYSDSKDSEPNRELRTAQKHLVIALFSTVLIGTATLGFLAPVWLKLCHLTAANLAVITAVRFAYFRGRVTGNPPKPPSILP